MIRRLTVLLTLLVAQAIPATAQSREKGLDSWLDRDLIPYVRQQLLSHPRFKNETVMFVIMRDNAPASSSNALALSLRDRLLAAAVDTAGVSISWQQGRNGTRLASRPHDCTRDAVHYYIGLELTQELDSRYSVSVRALDLEDRMETDMEKGRTDTAKLNGVTEEGAGKRPSFEIVVVIFAVLFLKVNGKVFLPLVDQLCGQNAKRCVFLASLPIFSLIENFEVISRSDVSMKVHIPAKDIHKLGNDCGM